MDNGLGLYLHFPFCKSKCFYCDFNSYSGMDELIPDYMEALVMEIHRSLPQHRHINSVYFGGGTPSFIPAELLMTLLRFIRRSFFITPHTEITLEVNPGTVRLEDLIYLKEAGFNRLSIGLQATQNELLRTIGRIHSWEEFISIYELVRETGFDNVGVDLIFGLPGQEIKDWQESLGVVLALNPEHISVYGLQLEKETRLAAMVGCGEVELPTEEETVAMMQLAMSFLPEHGYEHYEISNYARPGYRSVHNMGYWQGRDYLGFGAGATSTNYGERWTNVKAPRQYIDAIRSGCLPADVREVIDNHTALVEGVMLGLRLREGFDPRKFSGLYQTDILSRIGPKINDLIDKGLLVSKDGNPALTDEGILISNYVIGKLIDEI